MHVWVTEEILNPKKDLGDLGLEATIVELEYITHLFDCNCGLPRLLFVKNRQADGARRIDVGMEQRRIEFA